MNLFVVCNGDDQFMGLYDDRKTAEAIVAKNGDSWYFYEFDLNHREYFENDGAICDIDSI